jgi:hypothetical protein
MRRRIAIEEEKSYAYTPENGPGSRPVKEANQIEETLLDDP